MIPSSPVMRLPLSWLMSRRLHRYRSSRTVSEAIVRLSRCRAAGTPWDAIQAGTCMTKIQFKNANSPLPSLPFCSEWRVDSKTQRDRCFVPVCLVKWYDTPWCLQVRSQQSTFFCTTCTCLQPAGFVGRPLQSKRGLRIPPPAGRC
jgi:hypothetical protein